MHYSTEFYFQSDPLVNPNREGFSKLNADRQFSMARFSKKYLRDSLTVADICCGSGFMADIVPYRKHIGVDHPDMVSLVTRNGRYTRQNTMFVPFDFEDSNGSLDLGEKVDVVLSFESIEHMNSPEKFIYHVRQNLKDKGRLILSTPNNPYGNLPVFKDHIREYSLEEMTRILQSIGFELEDSFAMGVPFGFLIAVLEKNGIKIRRHDPEVEERSNISLLVDRLVPVRKIYSHIIHYNIGPIKLGDLGTNIIMVAARR